MRKVLLLVIAITLSINVFAQKKGNNKEDQSIQEYKEQVNSMVKYLEETLSFIGDPENTTHEKDIIFKESYLKIFKDEDVQIEDDLDANRRTSINKDVQAYLKDVDFFFKDIKFNFNVEKIETKTTDDDNTYFLVKTLRLMNGHNILGDSVDDKRQRFIEINLDPFKKDLKIASIYTTKPNENEELRNWWNKMPSAWKQYFGANNYLFDSIELTTLKHIYLDSLVIENYIGDSVFEHTMAADMPKVYSVLSALSKTTEIDISYNQDIHSLDPLQEMSDITDLDCSHTDVFDVSPIRNLSKIKNLNISNTDIDDISSLKYNSDMLVMRADNTKITSIDIVANFSQLVGLSLAGSSVTDISPISGCQQLNFLDISGIQISTLDSVIISPTLHNLNISNTNISDLTPIKDLENLQSINFDNTLISDLTPLAGMHKLTEIQCNNTQISDLMPVKDLEQLIRIYCDNTNVDANMAREFNTANRRVMVIFETATLKSWWESLPVYWKKAFMNQTNIGIDPSSEELHHLIQIKSLEVEAAIQDALPISKLINLETLNIQNTKIIDIEPLHSLLNLKSLNMKNTKISSLQALEGLENLHELNIENTLVSDLSPLQNSGNLLIIKAENSKITSKTVFNLKLAQPNVTVIYQTGTLKTWWNALDNNWRNIFKGYVDVDANPTPVQLQKISDLTEIVVDPKVEVTSLEALSMLPFLKKLIINDNRVTDLSSLAGKQLLAELNVNGNAIDNIIPLTGMTSLLSLSIESTRITDINSLEGMANLKVLSIANTSIKSLKPLTNCNQLEELNIANTPVKTLAPILNIPTLKHIKAFNSRIKSKDIESLKATHPDINVLYY